MKTEHPFDSHYSTYVLIPQAPIALINKILSHVDEHIPNCYNRHIILSRAETETSTRRRIPQRAAEDENAADVCRGNPLLGCFAKRSSRPLSDAGRSRYRAYHFRGYRGCTS